MHLAPRLIALFWLRCNDLQEYPFSRGSTHIQSPNPYAVPDFDAGFMNDKRDMAPMVWGYIKSRETARRMGAYAGEVTGMHPHFAFNSPARARDLDLETTKAYAGPNHITAGIQHGVYNGLSLINRICLVKTNTTPTGSWSEPLGPGKQPLASTLNSNRHEARESLQYSKEDIAHIEKWGMLIQARQDEFLDIC